MIDRIFGKLILLLIAGTAVAPANAFVRALTLRGTVSELVDPAALLGTVAVGTAYTLVYRADFSRGIYGGGGGGFGGSTYLLGGTSVDDRDNPAALVSPISASLFVGGRRLDFGGSYYGEMSYIHNSFDVMFGGTGESWAVLTANGEPGAPGGDITSRIDSDDFHTFLQALESPLSVGVDGVHIRENTEFSYSTGTPDSRAASASGVLSATSYSVTDVPEPATWMLMIGGFGVTGTMMRRRASLLPARS